MKTPVHTGVFLLSEIGSLQQTAEVRRGESIVDSVIRRKTMRVDSVAPNSKQCFPQNCTYTVIEIVESPSRMDSSARWSHHRMEKRRHANRHPLSHSGARGHIELFIDSSDF